MFELVVYIEWFFFGYYSTFPPLDTILILYIREDHITMATTNTDKMPKRTAKVVTNKEDLDYLLNTTSDDCTKLSLMMECFGDFNGKRRFNPYDILHVPPGVYGPPDKKNKNAFTTTVGLFVFNRAFIEKELIPTLGYVNEPVTKKVFKKLNSKVSYAVIEDDIPLEYMKRFILLTQKFQAYVDILSPSFTPAMLNSGHLLAKKKEELIKKYQKGIEECDTAAMQEMENELLKDAKELLKDDPSIDMINSGAKISIGNNYKNMFVMRGASRNSDRTKGEFSVILGSYMDGIPRDEYAAFADSLTGGPYARAKKTEVGGAWEKMFVRAFQHVMIDDKLEDCGTKRTIDVKLTKDSIKEWLYSYMVEDGQLVELTSKNMDKYIGKTVKMRYAGLCESKGNICHHCAGTLFTRIGIYNVGVASYAICSKLKNLSMKSFHDSTVKMVHMQDYGWDKIFGDVR